MDCGVDVVGLEGLVDLGAGVGGFVVEDEGGFFDRLFEYFA